MTSGKSRWNFSGSSDAAEGVRRGRAYWWLWVLCALPVIFLLCLFLRSGWFLTRMALPAAGGVAGWSFAAEDICVLSRPGRIRVVNFVAVRKDCYLSIPRGSAEVSVAWRRGRLHLVLNQVRLEAPTIVLFPGKGALEPVGPGNLDGALALRKDWSRILLRNFLLRDGLGLVYYARDRHGRLSLRHLAGEYMPGGDWLLRGHGGFSLERSRGELLACGTSEIAASLRLPRKGVPVLCRGRWHFGDLAGRVGDNVLPPTSAALSWELARERGAWRIRRFQLAENRGERPGEIILSGNFNLAPALSADIAWRVPYVSDTLAALFMGWFLPGEWHVGDASGSGRFRLSEARAVSTGMLRCVRFAGVPQVRYECTARYDVRMEGHRAPYAGRWRLRSLDGEIRAFEQEKPHTVAWRAEGEGAWDDGVIALDGGRLRVACDGRSAGEFAGRGEIDWFGGTWKLRGGCTAGPYWSDGEIKRMEGDLEWVSSGKKFGAEGRFDFEAEVRRLEFLCMQSIFSGKLKGSGSWKKFDVQLDRLHAEVKERDEPLLAIEGSGQFRRGEQGRMTLRARHLKLSDARRVIGSLDSDWLATPTRDWAFGDGMLLDCTLDEVVAESGARFSGTGSLDWRGGRFVAKPVFKLDAGLLDCEILSRGTAAKGIYLHGRGYARKLDVSTTVRMFLPEFDPGNFRARMDEGRGEIACDNLCAQNGPASWSGEAIMTFGEMVLDSSLNKSIVGRILLSPFFALGGVGSLLPDALSGVKKIFSSAGSVAGEVGVFRMDRGEVDLVLAHDRVKLGKCRFEGGWFRSLSFGGEVDLSGKKPLDLTSTFDFGVIALPMRIEGTLDKPTVKILKFK